MPFRNYGGRNRSAISNYVNSEFGSASTFNVSNVVGEANSNITINSDIIGNDGFFNRLTLTAETITENPQGVVPKYWIENLVRTGGIPPGKYYSDYIYWNNGTNVYDVDSTGTVHLGSNAGSFNQGPVGIAIGDSAGYQDQQNGSIAIGPGAGYFNQGTGAIALGDAAGFYSQSSDAIAIGYQAGQFDQLEKSIVIGYQAGNVGVGEKCILIGSNTIGNTGSTGSVAIGYNATISDSNQIVLGTTSETVYVPGDLDVVGASLLAQNSAVTLVSENNQGAFVGWNSVGTGITDFVNSSGLGPGGFNFYNVSSDSDTGNPSNTDYTTSNPLVTIGQSLITLGVTTDVSGNLGVAGSVTTNNVTTSTLTTSTLLGTYYTITTTTFTFPSTPTYLYYIYTSTSSTTLTLPTATNYQGTIFYLVTQGSQVDLTSSGSSTIYYAGTNASTITALGTTSGNSGVSIFCDGTDWYVW